MNKNRLKLSRYSEIRADDERGDMNLTELMNITFDDNDINKNGSLEIISDIFMRAIMHNAHKIGKR